MARVLNISLSKKTISSTDGLSPGAIKPASAASAAALAIVYQPIDVIRPASRPVRRRGKHQIEQLIGAIRRFGCRVPILVTNDAEIVDGHAIFEACKALGMTTIPTLVIDDLNPEEIRALRISINKIAEGSEWSIPDLKLEFEHLFKVDPELVAFTGFPIPEIDTILRPPALLDEDEIPAPTTGPSVSRLGDIWVFDGGHKLLCGNARDGASYRALLVNELIQMLFSDIPYGVPISHVSQSHGEFVEGSDMSEEEAYAFFLSFLNAATPHLVDGAIVDSFIDWRGMRPLLNALKGAGLQQQGMVVWDKESGAMGSLYRQQTEYVVIAKWGAAPHINNVQLGKHGRNRTTLWRYPGLARQQAGRKEALAMHPTVKPLGLLTEALLDTSRPGGLVLDPFAGSGSLMLAAHRVNRIARAIELDPKYVDVAVRRMEAFTGMPARLQDDGRTFAEVADERLGGSPAPATAEI